MKQHLKTLAAPKTWPVSKSWGVFITRPFPSGALLEHTLPIDIALKLLGKASNTREVKYILHNNTVLVDGVKAKHKKTPVKLLSTLSFQDIDEHYRLVISPKKKLCFENISKNEAQYTIARVNNKTMLKHGVLQVNLSNGWNFLMNAFEQVLKHEGLEKLNTYDSVLIHVLERKPVKVLPLKQKAAVLALGGRHLGIVGVFQGFEEQEETSKLEQGVIKSRLAKHKKTAIIKRDDQLLKVQLANLIVVGFEKPELTVSVKNVLKGA